MLIQASRTWTAPSFAADDMILHFQNSAECQEFVRPHTNEMDFYSSSTHYCIVLVRGLHFRLIEHW
jgi:hypothetical protein